MTNFKLHRVVTKSFGVHSSDARFHGDVGVGVHTIIFEDNVFQTQAAFLV